MIKIDEEGYHEFTIKLQELVKEYFGTFGTLKGSTELTISDAEYLGGDIVKQHFCIEFDTAYKIEKQ